MKKLKVRLEFVTPVLGTAPADKEIFSTYIASNAPDALTLEEEIKDSSAQEVEEKKMTVFFKDPETGIPYLYDYMIKGFFKNACKAMKQSDDSKTGNLSNYKGKIDNNIFIEERKISFSIDDNLGTQILQRPLRAETPQGPRVALSSSEMILEGASLEFSIVVLTDNLVPMIKEWLDYGILNGLCQWHNGGYGRFGWELISEEDIPIKEGMKFMQQRYTYKKITLNNDTKTIEATNKTVNNTKTEDGEEEKKPRRGRPKKKSEVIE